MAASTRFLSAGAVAFVKAFFDAGKPVAAICHAPWALAEADVVRGRRMTSWPSLQTDLRNAGATWVDEEVVVDGAFLSGADGVVPGLGNVDPCGYVQQYKAYREGDWEAVVQIQDRLALLMTITSVTEGAVGFGAGVGAFKTALQLLGVFETNQMPRPVRALEGGNVEAVRNVLVAAGMLAR